MNTSNITNYKPKDFAGLLGVSVKTLQRWDREGILKQTVLQLIGVITLMTNISSLKAFIPKMMIVRRLFMPEYLRETKRMICKTRQRFYVKFCNAGE